MPTCACGCGQTTKVGQYLKGHHFRGQPLKTREQKLEARRVYRATHRQEKRERDRKWRETNKDKLKANGARFRFKHVEKIKKYQKAYQKSEYGRSYRISYTNMYYANPINRMRLLVKGAFRRAKRAGWDFDEDLLSSLMATPPLVCGCCGQALDYSMRRGNCRLSPSLDRFNNAKGYTLANVVVICMRCNAVKGAACLKELETVIAYMRNHSFARASTDMEADCARRAATPCNSGRGS